MAIDGLLSHGLRRHAAVPHRRRRPERQRAAAATLARRLAAALLARQGQTRALRQRRRGRAPAGGRQAGRCASRCSPQAQLAADRAHHAVHRSPTASTQTLDAARPAPLRRHPGDGAGRPGATAARRPCRRRLESAAVGAGALCAARRRPARLAAVAAAGARRSAWSTRRCRSRPSNCAVTAQVLACGQFALEGDLVGLYDVFTAPAARGSGLATLALHAPAGGRARPGCAPRLPAGRVATTTPPGPSTAGSASSTATPTTTARATRRA